MSNATITSMVKDTNTVVPPPDVSPETIHYRVIADDELSRLDPLFLKLGWAPPDPAMAKIVVAEAGEGDKALILGFAVVQFVVHTEPFWCHPGMRGTGLAEELMQNVTHYAETDCKVKRYVAIAKPGSFAARLCEQNGMVPFPGQLYVKQIG